MATGLVAEFADIDLEDGDSSGVEGMQAGLIELRLKGWIRDGPFQHFKLFGSRGEGIVSPQSGQRHISSHRAEGIVLAHNGS